MELNDFERFLYEAPDDDPPDIQGNQEEEDTGPPDIGDMGDDGPPDVSDVGDDGPPDLGDEFGDDQSGDGMGEDYTDDQSTDENLGLDEKISAIMNQSLYKRFLTLLNKIGNQISSVNDSSDILHSLSPESINIIDSLKRLDENIRMYLKNYFINENYSKNQLFFNKCLNLLSLLDITFDKNIQKGIKAM